ncbi:MAG: fatty acid desaturase [Nitrospinae bacterium]|jgi:beta-carotene hydroxylase|nr:fatty acid desaturase [Nitrospinota bacterium]MDA1110829.1 fatty acid desaturase [Nitrospinota bacterium]
MLQYKEDIRTLFFMTAITALLIVQWKIGEIVLLLYIPCLILAVSVSIMVHNHIHIPLWKSKTLNLLTDYWLTFFYGYPICGWIPTHVMSHHVLNNQDGDTSRTDLVGKNNNILTLLIYPMATTRAQLPSHFVFLKKLWKKNRQRCYKYISQFVVFASMMIIAIIWDWKKALLFIFIPQQTALTTVLFFNYVQHIHADRDSRWNHTRDFIGKPSNYLLLNNGYHGAHHESPKLHWSQLPVLHSKIENNINPVLIEKNILWFFFRVYILGIFFKCFHTQDLRAQRLKEHATVPQPAS